MNLAEANVITNRLFDVCATATTVYKDENGKEVREEREFGQACGTCILCEARIFIRELYVEYMKVTNANPHSA